MTDINTAVEMCNYAIPSMVKTVAITALVISPYISYKAIRNQINRKKKSSSDLVKRIREAN